MSTLAGLNGRLARAEKKAPKPPEIHTIGLDLSLFTEEEQTHLSRLFELIENAFDIDHLHRLTHTQFEYMCLALHMHEVDPESEQAATRHRKMAELALDPHFSQRFEQLVELFLSLDENRIPDYAEMKEWWKHPDELPPDYRLRRSWYRQRKAHIEREMARCAAWRGEPLYFNSPTYEAEMRQWVDAYGDA
jgi:hypothetical protein